MLFTSSYKIQPWNISRKEAEKVIVSFSIFKEIYIVLFFFLSFVLWSTLIILFFFSFYMNIYIFLFVFNFASALRISAQEVTVSQI